MKSHTHKDELGILHKCYHKCRSTILSPGFWIGMTLGYPFEHILWEKVPPFMQLNELLHSLL